MSAAHILRNSNDYFACSVNAKDERRKSDREKYVKKADCLELNIYFTLTSIVILFTISPRMQSIQTDGLVWEGCVFWRKIAHLACDGVLESGALQLSNEPSLDQIAQDFPTFLGTFRTEYPKWSDISDPSRKVHNSHKPAVTTMITAGGCSHGRRS